MWKTLLNKSIKEVRLTVRQGPDHHGIWYFVEKKLPELIMLNQNTFFAVNEISEEFKTRSTLYINYNHAKVKDEAIEIDGLSSAAFEELLKAKVDRGLALERRVMQGNEYSQTPLDIVEAGKTVKYLDDNF